jgi:glycosyltransferase involved in cell wall biosynthesis
VNKANHDKDLSIIITCYNEGERLEPGITRLIKLLDLTRLDYEIVVVDDNSTDGSRERIKDIVNKYKRIRNILHDENRGRGAAVTSGIKGARGRVVGFNDLDFSTDPVNIIRLYEEIVNGADIATASRVYKLVWTSLYVLHRYILHKGYKILVKFLFRTPLIDTETGCKFFNRNSVLSYLDEIKDSHWFWDTEVMLRGYYHGMKISEVPTLFIRDPRSGSTVRVARDVRRYLFSIIKFYLELKRETAGTVRR